MKQIRLAISMTLLSFTVQLSLANSMVLAEVQEVKVHSVHSSGSARPASRDGLVHTHFTSAPGRFDLSLAKMTTLPNVSPGRDWPSPVDDAERRTMVLVDVLEYRPQTRSTGSQSDYRWDIEGWYGGDYNRIWFKTEGQRNTAFKADYDVDFQLLYGRFIQKYYDFQIGGRVETQTFRGANVTRGL